MGSELRLYDHLKLAFLLGLVGLLPLGSRAAGKAEWIWGRVHELHLLRLV